MVLPEHSETPQSQEDSWRGRAGLTTRACVTSPRRRSPRKTADTTRAGLTTWGRVTSPPAALSRSWLPVSYPETGRPTAFADNVGSEEQGSSSQGGFQTHTLISEKPWVFSPEAQMSCPERGKKEERTTPSAYEFWGLSVSSFSPPSRGRPRCSTYCITVSLSQGVYKPPPLALSAGGPQRLAMGGFGCGRPPPGRCSRGIPALVLSTHLGSSLSCVCVSKSAELYPHALMRLFNLTHRAAGPPDCFLTPSFCRGSSTT